MHKRVLAGLGLGFVALLVITAIQQGPSTPSRSAVATQEVEQASAAVATAVAPASVVPVRGPQVDSPFGAAWRDASGDVHARFRSWTDRYLAAAPLERAALLDEGLDLAHQRRAELAPLIRTDPRRALALAVPMVVRQKLPAEIVELLEARVSGRGELALQAVTPEPGRQVAEPMFRATIIAGQEYRAYVYGRREAYGTVGSTSMVGIAIDRDFAISEAPLRVLEAGELAGARPIDQVCSVSGNATPAEPDTPLNVDEPVAVEYAGKVQVLCSSSHIGQLQESLLAAEVSPRVAGDNLPGSSGVTNRPTQTWTHGTKKVLIIRVDFSDLAGTPTYGGGSTVITDDYVVNLFNNSGGIADFYTQGSYGKSTLSISAAVSGDSPDVTPVYRMPRTALYYATGSDPSVAPYTALNSLLHTDAQTLATNAGYNLANYDRVGVVFARLSNIANSQITYGGLGNVDGKNFWINSWFDFRVVAHEIGHNYGLQHANLWQVSDGNPVSAGGSSTEYGDPFDVMGANGDITRHFSHWNKSILQWIPDAAVTTVQSPGTYRVYRFDAQAANLANARALKVVRDSVRDYWIGYRRGMSNASLSGGAYILWGYNTNQQGDLLDMTTPGTSANDAGLAIGQTFNDTARGVTIRPVAQGGSGAEEYLDVEIGLSPMLSFAATAITVGENDGTATLTVTRSRSSSGAVTVDYATASGTATSGSDFTATSGTLTWADGDASSRTITVPITADATAETTENFTVTLSNATGAVLSDAPTATVTIADAGVRDPLFSAEFINNSVDRVLPLPDGSYVLGGDFTLIQTADFTSYTRGRLAKVGPTGLFDVSFASGTGASGSVRDMALQPDGKILIAGTFTTVHGVARNNIARLNADGSLDTSFDPGTGADNTVNALLLQPDGKVVIGGRFLNVRGTAREYLARLNTDGTLDTSFVGPDFAATSGWRVEALAMQSDGKIVVGGVFYFSGAATNKASVCRIAANGTLDATFTGVAEGAHVLGTPSSLSTITAVAVQSDGKIWIGGNFTAYNAVARTGLARLNSDGSLDTSLNPTLANSGGAVACNVLTPLPGGGLMVGGAFTSLAGGAVNNLAVLDSSGALNTAFAAKGGPGGTVRDLALLPDGRVMIASAVATLQSSTVARPIWRVIGPLSGAPGEIQFSASTATALEGTSATLTVTRSGNGVGALSVGYASVAGTAGSGDYTSVSGVLSWANGDVTSRTISVPLTFDVVADPGETVFVQLGQPRVGGALLGANQRSTITIGDIAGYALFVATQFTVGEQANAAISGANADPDGDGIPNLIEYALGLNPKSADAGANTSVSAVGGEWVFTYSRPAGLTDITYSVEYSTNLSLWTTSGVTHELVSSSGGTEIWRARVTATGTNTAFFRLRVTR